MADDESFEKAYSRERLIAEADAFLGVPKHVAAGALHGSKSDLTVTDAKRLCREWLGTQV